MSTRRISRRHGVCAAMAALAAAGAFGAVGVAGAEETRSSAAADVTIQAQDTDWSDKDVTIQTGDTVTWTFAGTNLPHNIASGEESGSPDPRWDEFVEPGQFQDAPDDAAYDFTFTEPGDYTFVCEFHEGPMTGVIHVEGDPVPTPTPDPDPDPTPTPDPDPTPDPEPQPSNPGTGGGGSTTGSGMQHDQTPAPSIASSADTVAPAVTRVSAKTLRNRRVRLRFSLSEPASVTIRFKRAGRKGTVRTARVMGHTGRNSVKIRSRAFTSGRRFVARLQARDALGNRSSTERKRLTIRRRG